MDVFSTMPPEPPPEPFVRPLDSHHLTPRIFVIFFLAIVLLTTASALVAFYVSNKTKETAVTSQDDISTVQPTSRPSEPQNETETWNVHTYADMGISFKAPPEMEVSSEAQKNDAGVPYSYTLYVQKGQGGQSDYYQLYGLYQLGSQFMEGSLESMKQELNPNSVKDVTIGGLAGIDGQIQGERNRFVTHIITKKGRLSLFTAEPTIANKQLTDRILSTFVFSE